jgi:HD-GYP domain-containing protein (c-di-GMP phosphodiesterase class II)
MLPPRPRPLELRYILFLLLLMPAIIPLLLSAHQLIGKNKQILKSQQTELLTHFVKGFADGLSDTQNKEQLRQLGRGLVAAPGFGSLERRLQSDWATAYLSQFAKEHTVEIRILRVFDHSGGGPATSLDDEAANAALDRAFAEALDGRRDVIHFTTHGLGPAAVIAVPVGTPDGDGALVIQALVDLPVRSQSLEVEEMFLIDADGKLLWSAGNYPQIQNALLASELVGDFARTPISVSSELALEVAGQTRSILARVVPVAETGWGVVAHKETSAAFRTVRDMIQAIILSSVLAVLLAFGFAVLASGWFSRPIQRLAVAAGEIAGGNFDRRVPTTGVTKEVVKLAEDFNRMSDYVESYIERLQRAAEANRELFISTIRAFAAAIDAKDPYTRGHSERVARYSREIARYLGLPKDIQEKVWISAVLHDVGKIGVDDQVLSKMGELTPEEFDKMKQHPAIGADIVEPISALREMLPGIRWHHEAWNGGGYPDGLKGEEIPLMARVIGVADTFDAITTSRPYQRPSSPERAMQIIKQLTGRKFDAKIVTAFLLAWEAGHIRMDSAVADDAGPQPLAVQARSAVAR